MGWVVVAVGAIGLMKSSKVGVLKTGERAGLECEDGVGRGMTYPALGSHLPGL